MVNFKYLTLITTVNETFEILDYIEKYEINNEIISLKISLNNLLKAFDESEEGDFYKIMLLSSPILFDFMFNDYVKKENIFLKKKYKHTRYYKQAKQWYKFVRNSLIHTNRYTYNQITKKISRIEYGENVSISFELNERNGSKHFEKFKNNIFFLKNVEQLKLKGINAIVQKGSYVRIVIDYDYFMDFIFNEVKIFISCLISSVDNFVLNEIRMWEEYYKYYLNEIKEIISSKNISLERTNVLFEKLKKIKILSDSEKVIIIEFLYYLITLTKDLEENEVKEIVNITNFDPYNQSDRLKLINEIVIEKQKYKLEHKVVKEMNNTLKDLGINTKTLEYTNYLIIYVENYLNKRMENNV